MKIDSIPITKLVMRNCSMLLISVVLLLSYPTLSASQQSERKKVLALFAFRPTLAVSIVYDRGIRSIFESSNTPQTLLNIEFMDLTHFTDEHHVRTLVDVYRLKYSDPKPDLVIAVVETAVNFVLEHREDLFPGVPVVIGAVENRYVENRALGKNITGHTTAISYTGTLELALKLHPDTQNIVVYSGASHVGVSLGKSCREAFRSYEDRFKFTYLLGPPMEELLERVAALPKHTVLIHLAFWRDGAGKEFVGNQVISEVARVANAPVYSFWIAAVGAGIVGGHVNSLEEEGKAVARLGLRLLNGEKPESIPIIPAPSLRYMFDWRQLQRWSINEDRLPPGSIVRFKELSLWNKYKGRIIVAISILIFQTLVIAVLLNQRFQRRRAELKLKERLHFENKISEFSSEFINLSSEKLDTKILDTLAWIGPFIRADRSHIFQFNLDRTEFRITHLWEAEGIKKDNIVYPGLIVKEAFPWLFDRLTSSRNVVVPDVEKLSVLGAEKEYRYCREMGIESFVILPMEVENAPLCAIGLDSIGKKRAWSKEVQDRLRIIGEIFTNTIARLHAEEKSEVAALRYRTVADFTYDWEYWQNPDGTLQYVSPSSERICGYQAQALMQNPGLLRDMIVAKDKAAWDEHRSRSQKEMRSEQIQFRVQRPDGEVRWIEHACQPVFDSNGVYQGVRASNRDITEREYYKSETQQLQTELAHMDRVVTISALTSALAHEINQPLAAMRTYAQAALRFMDKQHPDYDRVRNALQGIVSDNIRATEVVNRLRDLVQKGPAQRETIDINSVINGVIRLINSELVLRSTTVTLNLHSSLPVFQGDSIQIQQVLINLLTNALDAMNDQPVEVRTIALSTGLEESDKIIIAIRDAGAGIREDKIESIFTPFHSTKPTGMGLGLSICRSIVEAHGGEITAENNPNGGATFSIILPIGNQTQ